MMSYGMKVLSAAIGVMVLIATPSLASKAHKKKVPSAKQHASQTQRGQTQPAYDVNAIYGWGGEYRGSDPDPNIRFQLLRDQNMPND